MSWFAARSRSIALTSMVSACVAAPGAPTDATGSLEPATLYPEGGRHSPVTKRIVSRLQAIAASGSRDPRVFAKVGDSHTSTPKFLACFDGESANLGHHASLAGTIAHFAAGDAAGASPFARTSLAAAGGTTARDAHAGAPCTLDREIDAIDPQLAIVMFGTNEIRYGWSFDDFGTSLWELVDKTIANGVVPLVSTIPPIGGDPATDARIPTANRIIRAIAQGREVPLVDLHRELLSLPGRGLDADQLHLSASPAGSCTLTDAATRYGQNVRNLVTLESLARARAALDGASADDAATERTGAGTAADPFRASLPIVDLVDTEQGDAAFDRCARPQTGRERVFRLDLEAATPIEATLVDRGNIDADVHIVAGALETGTCLASGDRSARAMAGPGPVFIVVDTPSAMAEGEVIVVVEQR